VKTLCKKNQLMITALAIMLAIAAYLQFAVPGAKTLGEDTAVEEVSVLPEETTDTTLLDASALEDIWSLDTEDLDEVSVDAYEIAEELAIPEDGEIPGTAVFTSADGVQMIADARLLKEQTRAKNKETLMEVINSAELTTDQKVNAVNTMVHMTDIAEKETAAEILLEAKGFSDVIVCMNGEAVDVVVNALELDEAQRAQIEDIVTRKTLVEPQNIIISTIAE